MESLESQELSKDAFEVVLVDNGSGDDTWSRLSKLIASTALQATAISLSVNRGPGGGRNVGVEFARAPLLVFTDDDCLPTPGWLEGLLAGFESGADIVQGRVAPDPEGITDIGPWDHTIDIGCQTVWFETSNVAYRRRLFERVSGFDESDAVTGRQGGRHAFGEDAVLAWRVVQQGGVCMFADDAVVYHRVIPRTYRDFVVAFREFVGFPGLVRRSEIVENSLLCGIFLNKETAWFDVAAVSLLLALATRKPALLFGVIPWADRRWSRARQHSRRRWGAAVRLAQFGLNEAVGLASLIEGSVRHRRIVL
jgi:glycosyltransferase involved in cell wall biosynthesis